MYQGNERNGKAKQRVRYESFYFIVRFFFKLLAYPFFNYPMFFKDYPELNPNFFSIYKKLKQITHRKELKHINHRQVLQKTPNRYHRIP